MTHDIPRSLRVGLGMAFVVLALASTVLVLNYGQGYYDEGYDITATFPTSSQGIYADGGTSVKLRGLDIGSVSDIELLPDGSARITLFIDEGVEVPVGAQASIEPLSVFGPKFIRIDPGPTELSGPFLTQGGEIVDTVNSPELTDILAGATELFEQVDPYEVVAIFDAVSEGFIGLGPELGATIDDAATLVAIGADHAADLESFLDDAAQLSAFASSRAGQLDALLDDAQELVPIVVEQADDVDALLAATTSVAADITQLLADNQGSIDAFVTGTGRFADGIYLHADEIPGFIDLLNTFFGRLTDIIRMPAPEGRQAAALRGFVSLEPCLLLGVCGAAGASDGQVLPLDPILELVEGLVG